VKRMGIPSGVPEQPVLIIGPCNAEATTLCGSMRAGGWTLLIAEDLDRASWLASIQKIALILIAGGPDTDKVVHAIRPVSNAPLVVLGSPTPQSVISLVESGVDAVIDIRAGDDDVLARLGALLRRVDRASAPGVRFLRADGLSVDLLAREVERNGTPLALSPTEYAVLTLLMARPHEALPVQTIVRQVWGWSASDGRNALRIIVNRLRRKLEDDPHAPRYIAAVRGVGYRFNAEVIEMGDQSPTPSTSHRNGLLNWIEGLAFALIECDSVAEAGVVLLDSLSASGYAEGMAIFQVDREVMHLVAVRGMSQAWTDRVAAGIPLDPSFASAQSVLTGEPVQFGDIHAVGGHFRATAEQLVDEGVRAGHFFPIPGRHGVWGNLGLVRRSGQPFDESAMAFSSAMCAVFAARVDGLSSPLPSAATGGEIELKSSEWPGGARG
jgi:two-component system KDP operon response regulator KdpE